MELLKCGIIQHVSQGSYFAPPENMMDGSQAFSFGKCKTFVCYPICWSGMNQMRYLDNIAIFKLWLVLCFLTVLVWQ